MLAGKTIAIGITGGVAAHYLPELIGQLRVHYMATVYVAMTGPATHFVSPLTVAVAAGTPVWTDVFASARHDPLMHIHLAHSCDLVLVAPASFDFIGKAAAGLADDPVTLLLAATTAPVFLAPAMHDTMWANRILQRNLATLTGFGHRIIPPEVGLQGTGDIGEGRMASISTILAALSQAERSGLEKAQE